jgi:hypothetical protein
VHVFAATATDSPQLWLAGLVAAAGYAISCAIWPFRACRRCGGIGRFRSPSGRAWRNCRSCRGTGAKIRLGRRIYTALKHTHNRADHDRD